MPLVLRKIRKPKWYKHAGTPWLPDGELQADALGDLLTSNNTLSVWLVTDDKSNLEQVVTALAANYDSISNVDYALFDQQVLSELEVGVSEVREDSPYDEINPWHRDLVELSASKLMALAKAIQTKAARERVLEKKVLELIRQAVEAGRIDAGKLKPNLSAKLPHSHSA